ncbi:hypothetical protein Tco_1467787 [Tanacetum coccineum]
MFDTDNLHGDEVIVDMEIGEKQEQNAKVDERKVSTGVEDSVAPIIPVTTAGEGVTATKIDEITTTSAPKIAINETTLAQTLIEIKAAKPKAVTTATTTTTTIRPKARGVVVQEPSEFRTTTSSPQASQPLKTKDKGKAIMIEPEVPLKKKDQSSITPAQIDDYISVEIPSKAKDPEGYKGLKNLQKLRQLTNDNSYTNMSKRHAFRLAWGLHLMMSKIGPAISEASLWALGPEESARILFGHYSNFCWDVKISRCDSKLTNSSGEDNTAGTKVYAAGLQLLEDLLLSEG